MSSTTQRWFYALLLAMGMSIVIAVMNNNHKIIERKLDRLIEMPTTEGINDSRFGDVITITGTEGDTGLAIGWNTETDTFIEPEIEVYLSDDGVVKWHNVPKGTISANEWKWHFQDNDVFIRGVREVK